MRQSKSQENDGPSAHDRLHSAPKGLLRYYILHKIAQKPIHGYEIIQDIDSKTEGAWRPGAGSLYPILKKLVSDVLDRIDQFPDFRPRQNYALTLAEDEMNEVERSLVAAQSVDEIEL